MSTLLRPAVFLDRDGTLNRAFVRGGVSHPPMTLEEFELLPGVVTAARRLAEAGLLLVVVTNQPDVARGLQSRAVVESMNERVCRELPVVGALTCYHDGPDGCDCRKPKPGLLLAAARRWGIDLARSFMVGDRWSDVAAGQAAGCRSALIEGPCSGRERCRPDHLAQGLADAAEWALHLSCRGRA
jgi:D-glycero-D-manno-heptose 1,7-bisphosphate phosphatase